MKANITGELFSGVGVGRVMLLALAKDASESKSEPPLGVFHRHALHPILDGVLDQTFLQEFLEVLNSNEDGMRAEVVLSYAELGYELTKENCPEILPHFIDAVATWSSRAGIIERAVPHVSEGLRAFPNAPPQMLFTWESCLAEDAYNRRSFREAAEHYKRALVHSRANADARQELNTLISLTACHTFLRNELEAIRCASEAEKIARNLGDLDSLTKTLGDQGNSEFRLQRIDRARLRFEEALAVAEQSGNKQRQSDWSGMLGNVWMTLEDLENGE